MIGIDVGGTKTLVCHFNDLGEKIASIRFETPKNYQLFIQDLSNAITQVGKDKSPIICIAAPGTIDRAEGIGRSFGNLSWHNVPIGKDVHRLSGCKVIVENDANVAALSEAAILGPNFSRVLYITISTGIGTGFVVNQYLEPYLLDSEGGHIIFEKNGKTVDWEDFASGRAIVERFGKRASELEDASIWKILAHEFALGIVANSAIFQPDAVVIGGGVGSHFHKYGDFLAQELKSITPHMVKVPKLFGAKNAEEAVIDGCYILAKQYEQHQ